MCSILCWILSIWDALGCIFAIFGLIHALSTRGEVWAYFGLLDAFRRFSGGFEPLLGSVAHRSDRSRSPVWSVRVLALVICWAPVWPVVVTGLTGGGDRSDRLELSWCSCSVFFKWFACIRQGGVALVQGELACVQGELFVAFELWFVVCALCLRMVLSQMCRAVALA
jgi:hypothetical protein